jgi:hypothetical protein
VSPLVRQYSAYRNLACVTDTNFQSGLQPEATMVFVLPRPAGVITPAELAAGVYTRTTQSDSANYAGDILDYFGKQTLLVVPNRPCDASATAWPIP